MSTAAVSSSSIYQQLQAYFQQRRSDVRQLGQDLQSGDLAAAQQDYATIQTLGQSGPFANGVPFKDVQREQDFTAIGQALQSGNVSTTQQAFKELQSTFRHDRWILAPQSGSGSSSTGSAPASGGSSTTSPGTLASPVGTPELILNLGKAPGNEQIVLNLFNAPASTPTQGNVNLNA